MHVDRRDILSGIASATFATGGTALLLNESTGTAKASVSMGSLKIDGAAKTTRDGTIKDVIVNVGGQWSYDVPGSKDPDKWQIVLWTERNDKKAPVAVSKSSAKYLSGSGEYSLEGSLINTELWNVGDFEEGTDGETKTTTVPLMVVFNVFNPNETVIAQAKAKSKPTVKVTNDGYKITEHGKVSGNGGVTIVS